QEAQPSPHVRRDGLGNEDQCGGESAGSPAGGGRQAVMRPDAAERDHAAPAARPRRAQEQLELAGLVTTVDRATEIVALDPRRRDAGGAAEPVGLRDGGRGGGGGGG